MLLFVNLLLGSSTPKQPHVLSACALWEESLSCWISRTRANHAAAEDPPQSVANTVGRDLAARLVIRVDLKILSARSHTDQADTVPHGTVLKRRSLTLPRQAEGHCHS